MHHLLKYINAQTTTLISQKDFDFLLSHFVSKKIRKKQFLLQKGEVCEHFTFVISGALRQYYIDEKGVERIVDLYIENFWVVDHDSFVNSTPSIFNIDAWEDGEVLDISKKNVYKLCNQLPVFKELLLNVIVRNNIDTQRRLTSINLTARQRYNWFTKAYPFFVNRFPQHIIASYLGITKDTLSRLLNRIT